MTILMFIGVHGKLAAAGLVILSEIAKIVKFNFYFPDTPCRARCSSLGSRQCQGQHTTQERQGPVSGTCRFTRPSLLGSLYQI